MNPPPLLVVAQKKSAINKFEQSSLSRAINIRDFLEQTGEYDEVTIFQLHSIDGPMKQWVKLNEPER
jgi:hypothetical protein